MLIHYSSLKRNSALFQVHIGDIVICGGGIWGAGGCSVSSCEEPWAADGVIDQSIRGPGQWRRQSRVRRLLQRVVLFLYGHRATAETAQGQQAIPQVLQAADSLSRRSGWTHGREEDRLRPIWLHLSRLEHRGGDHDGVQEVPRGWLSGGRDRSGARHRHLFRPRNAAESCDDRQQAANRIVLHLHYSQVRVIDKICNATTLLPTLLSLLLWRALQLLLDIEVWKLPLLELPLPAIIITTPAIIWYLNIIFPSFLDPDYFELLESFESVICAEVFPERSSPQSVFILRRNANKCARGHGVGCQVLDGQEHLRVVLNRTWDS